MSNILHTFYFVENIHILYYWYLRAHSPRNYHVRGRFEHDEITLPNKAVVPFYRQNVATVPFV